MNVTLNASACPAIQIVSTLHTIAKANDPDPVTANGEYPLSGKWVGTTAPWANNVNASTRAAELTGSYGGGNVYGVAFGLVLTAPGSGLLLGVSAGQAMMQGPVEVPVDTTLAVANVNGRAWIWIGQNSTLHAVPNNVLTPPDSSQDYCLLGSVVVAGGNLSVADYSGVVFCESGARVRYTADAGAPGDSPPIRTAGGKPGAGGLQAQTVGGRYEWVTTAGGSGTWSVLGVGQTVPNATHNVFGLVEVNTDDGGGNPVVFRREESMSFFGSLKPIARAVATSNVAALTGAATVDGQVLATGDILLLAAQSTGSQNGPWTVNTAGAWTRPSWYPAAGTIQAFVNAVVPVYAGTANAGTWWRLTTSGAITIDTTATAWSQVPAPLPATGTLTDTMTAGTWKPLVRLAATSNLSLTGGATIDGPAVVTGDLVLATAQTTGSQNGPWVINTSGAWTRPAWWAAGNTSQAFRNVLFEVVEGTVYADSRWRLATPTSGTITIDTTAVTFAQVLAPAPAGNPLVATATHSDTLEVGSYYTLTIDYSAVGTFTDLYEARLTCSDTVVKAWRESVDETTGVSSWIVSRPVGGSYYNQQSDAVTFTLSLKGDGWSGGSTSGIAATWTKAVWGESTKRAYTLELCSGLSSLATGADVAPKMVPFRPEDGTSIQWAVQGYLARLESAGSGDTDITFERSTGTAAFTVANDINTSPLVIPAADYEPTAFPAITNPTLNSGDKVRHNIGSLGSGADHLYLALILLET